MTAGRALLEGLVADVADDPALGLAGVIHENQSGRPPANRPWLRVAFGGGARADDGLVIEDSGLLSLTLWWPQATGGGAADAAADLLTRRLGHRRLEDSGVLVVTGAPRTGPGGAEGSFWTLPLEIPFRAVSVSGAGGQTP